VEKFLFGFSVSYVISGVVLGIFGPGYLALGPNHKSLLFDLSKFSWKTKLYPEPLEP